MNPSERETVNAINDHLSEEQNAEHVADLIVIAITVSLVLVGFLYFAHVVIRWAVL